MERVSYDKDELSRELIDLICKELMIDKATISPGSTIESLDFQSIDIVSILTAVEDKFDVYIPMDDSFHDAKTIQDLIDALAKHIQKKAA